MDENQESDELDVLKARRQHLKTQLERVTKAQDWVVYWQQDLEWTEWQIRALSNLPEEAAEIPRADLGPRLRRDFEYLQRNVPLMPQYNPSSGSPASAISTAGTVDIYQYVTRVGQLGTLAAQDYADIYTSSYRQLQEKQDRPALIRERLIELGSANLVERFDAALRAHYAVMANTGARTAAATDMRNLLAGLEGELFEKARQWPKENMTWQAMAGRLVRGEAGGQEHRELLRQEQVSGALNGRLSDVLKDREGGIATDLEAIWTQLVDHLFVVTGLVRLVR